MQYHQLQGRSSSSCRCKSNTTSMDRRRRQRRLHLSRVAGYPILGDVTFMKGEEDRNILLGVSALASTELLSPIEVLSVRKAECTKGY